MNHIYEYVNISIVTCSYVILVEKVRNAEGKCSLYPNKPNITASVQMD